MNLLLAGIAVAAPITSVTVHSGQARVLRTARLTIQGTETLELPRLPSTTDPDSVRLEAAGGGAEVVHISLRRLSAGDGKAEPTGPWDLEREDLDGRLASTTRQRAVFERLAGVAAWKPEIPDSDTPPGRRLDARSWRRAVAFLEGFAERMHARARAADAEESVTCRPSVSVEPSRIAPGPAAKPPEAGGWWRR